MENRNIKAFFNRITDRVGDEAEAAIAIVKKGEEITVHMAGVSEFMIDPNAVAIATSMRHLLDTDMRTADRIGQKRREIGCIRIDTAKMEITDNQEGKEDKADIPTDANAYGKMFAAALGDFLNFLEKHIEKPDGDE